MNVRATASAHDWLPRLIGLAVGVAVGVATAGVLSTADEASQTSTYLVTLGLAIGGIGYVLGPHISRAVVQNVRRQVASASTVDIVAIGFGLAFGALVSAPLALSLSYLPDPLGRIMPLLGAVALCSLAVAVALMRKRDLIAPWLKVRGGKSGPAPDARPLLLDTNIAIDGRVIDLAKSGFISGRVLIPRFVLDELQRIADSDDHQRRARGRRGLEVLTELGTLPLLTIDHIEDPVVEEREVDAKLMVLARTRNAAILTNDFNLARVARLRSIQVLNINELTNALRPAVLPGEELLLTVTQEGRETGQGVGYLADGTMVVVDGGRPLVGKHVPVTVTRLLQTGAGRMIFATPKHAA